MWVRRTLRLEPHTRGFHLITRQVEAALPEIAETRVGTLHVFILHTSAGLTLNESASPDVRRDFERFTRRLVPDHELEFEHTQEGPDDMPAHIKASLFGGSLLIPVEGGQLLLGTWQGIYLCEHRERAGARNLALTLHGERASEKQQDGAQTSR